MRKTLAAGALAVSLLAGTAVSAGAADTVATFEITAVGGALSISVPAGDLTTPLDLGSVAAGSATFSPTLGTVTVTDTRAALAATWTATATGSDFDLTTSGADPANDANQRVAAAAVAYAATPSADLGDGVVTPSLGTLASGSTIAYVGSGSNTVSWDPTLNMTLLPTQVAGVYQGTVTHSVS